MQRINLYARDDVRKAVNTQSYNFNGEQPQPPTREREEISKSK